MHQEKENFLKTKRQNCNNTSTPQPEKTNQKTTKAIPGQVIRKTSYSI